MYKIEISGLFSVSAPSMDEMETLIARATQLREQFKTEVQSVASVARINQAPVNRVIASPMGTPNVDAYLSNPIANPKGDERFRRTKEEKESGMSPDEAAKARLIALGLPTYGEDNGEGESQGVTWSGEIDSSYVPED